MEPELVQLHHREAVVPRRPAPVCGEDFCDACGDCLACYGEDHCYATSDGKHIWVKDLEQ